MAARRKLLLVGGDPARIASRAALRLAHLGDQVEPVSATEFVWRPQPAERKLFRCPAAVHVRVVPTDRPGESSVVLEWRGNPGGGWWWTAAGVTAALSALTALLLPDSWPVWKSLWCLWPPLAMLAAPPLFGSGWQTRLEAACLAEPTLVFSLVPEAEHWLELDEQRRVAVLREVREKAPAAAPEAKRAAATDRRSAVTFLGWPLWHVANGRDPITDRARVARGWYAVGQLSQGCLAIGQRAQGWLAIGQLAYGLIAIGQAAIGVIFGLGQLALSAFVAVGQVAGGMLAIGAVALGVWVAAAAPVGSDLPLWANLAAALGIPLAAVLAWLGTVLKLRSIEQQELLSRVDQTALASVMADEASLSPAARLTGEDPERGLSTVEADSATRDA